MTDYKDWCVPYGEKIGGHNHEEWLEEYTKWVFGPSPYPNQKEGSLFVHGDMENSDKLRRENVVIHKNDPIIVNVIGVNFILGEKDGSGNVITNEEELIKCCNREEQMDSPGKVEFKNEQDKSFTDLSSCVEQIRPFPIKFNIDEDNPDLEKWDVPMKPAGDVTGAWACQLLLLKIPQIGKYTLRFDAEGVSPFRSCGEYIIEVS